MYDIRLQRKAAHARTKRLARRADARDAKNKGLECHQRQTEPFYRIVVLNPDGTELCQFMAPEGLRQ